MVVAQMVKWVIIGFMFFIGIVGFWEINFQKKCTAKKFYEGRKENGSK